MAYNTFSRTMNTLILNTFLGALKKKKDRARVYGTLQKFGGEKTQPITDEWFTALEWTKTVEERGRE